MGFYARAIEMLEAATGPTSFVVAALVLVQGGVLVAEEQGWPKKFWKSDTGTAIFVCVVVVTSVAYFVVTFRFARLVDRGRQDQRLFSACRDIANLVSRVTTVPHQKIGVHVWSIMGPPSAKHLVRRANFRAVGHRRLSITWRKGKGAIGRCWATGETFVADLEALEARGADETRFCALPAETRFEMTWQEFQAGRRYRAIYVTPLRAGPPSAQRIRGCLSIDIQENGKAEELEHKLIEHEAELAPLLNICEQVLQGG